MIDAKHSKLILSYMIFLSVIYTSVNLASRLYSGWLPYQYAFIGVGMSCLYLLTLKHIGWKVDFKPIKENK